MSARTRVIAPIAIPRVKSVLRCVRSDARTTRIGIREAQDEAHDLTLL